MCGPHTRCCRVRPGDRSCRRPGSSTLHRYRRLPTTRRLLAAVQSGAAAGCRRAGAVWMVRRRAVGGGPSLDEGGLPQSPFGGLENVVAFEHPELSWVRLDLDPDEESNPSVVVLREIL